MARAGFEKLRVYQLSEKIADTIWFHVVNWDWLAQNTVGRQWVNAADSIGANLAEGYGRGSLAEKRRFAKISRGSLFEARHWLRRCDKRRLLSGQDLRNLDGMIDDLLPRISAYINSIGPACNLKA